ncbi:guanine deaminase [Nitrincola sp. A-D6]|uniref:guanine deaminase n=1 Tax=Nitrincola sp. A-D6 TaxID=1545442 RepID=UPI00051FEADC|nr:guanine deaminase [Nitrincola sp. A-D6]KGK43410.1 guanine deaminase [Nitrincola sp. A-D6]
MNQHAFRGSVLHYLEDPLTHAEHASEYIEDALLLVEDGKIKALAPYAELISTLDPSVKLVDYSGKLLMPGFIDLHSHYPQTEIIASYGKQLLDWLNNYTFPTESKFSDAAYAKSIAELFIDELLRNGTTTAMVFATVHKASADAFFEAAAAQNLRMIAGKVLMDRNAPAALCDTAESGYAESAELIEKWHGKQRLSYAVTPRFAPTSTPEQLHSAGQLLQSYPDVYLQSHLAENHDELTWVADLFPKARDYLDVYEQAGLLGSRCVYAHGIHLSDSACERLAQSGTVLAHCPTSNLFLGSGLFDMQRISAQGIRYALGTDVGGGTSFSMFRTLAEAYKIQQLQQHSLHPHQSLYLATLGGARALSLDHLIGNFLPGKEADFIVVDPQATPLLSFRTAQCESLTEMLFALTTLGDDRLIYATYILGNLAYLQEN